MDNEGYDRANRIIIEFMKVLRWPIEFIVVIFGGYVFVSFMNFINSGPGSTSGLYGAFLWNFLYWVIYLIGVIWISASRIVHTIKKNKDIP